eukprot:TRINITY_DN66147_c0_g1_i1.p1 TRINITY_DN66147_c0_g1~~TRINITY_DN66147_c0_g1_i1.p1  ORF type:complete len:114 (-),score=34.44 TRINITY_DN66147_c0_g1_i1:10-351(-)
MCIRDRDGEVYDRFHFPVVNPQLRLSNPGLAGAAIEAFHVACESSIAREHRQRKRYWEQLVVTAGSDSFEELSGLSLIHISEPTRLLSISYAVFCLKKKTQYNPTQTTHNRTH